LLLADRLHRVRATAAASGGRGVRPPWLPRLLPGRARVGQAPRRGGAAGAGGGAAQGVGLRRLRDHPRLGARRACLSGRRPGGLGLGGGQQRALGTLVLLLVSRAGRGGDCVTEARAPVLIVGAGPTGLVMALWLTRLGVRVRIVDKTAEPGTTSRAVAVQARTLEFYRQIGLADAVVARGITSRRRTCGWQAVTSRARCSATWVPASVRMRTRSSSRRTSMSGCSLTPCATAVCPSNVRRS